MASLRSLYFIFVILFFASPVLSRRHHRVSDRLANQVASLTIVGRKGTNWGGGGCTVLYSYGSGMYCLIFVGVAFDENLLYDTQHTCLALTRHHAALTAR
ncbi:hypothetical protein B9Z19DRAFT_1086360 [Tuber borchii]|uniref:Uncharacterized protein n=1 Tax=Tuber borchii TaxID=42251 RepID=A0A2T6ZPH4_TUBBO|nr:hypothetical protein B9Z19DRAFT_1086360 [Tuber borchii]